MTTKRCSHCKQPKPLAEFGRNSNGRGDGLQSWCKPCKAAAARAYRRANRNDEPIRIYTPRIGAGPRKLTACQVRTLRTDSAPSTVWAAKLGVSPSTVRAARRGETWRSA